MATAAYRSLLLKELRREGRSISLMVQLILADAQSRGASDVHIDPFSDRLLVRLRIDGLLSAVNPLKQFAQARNAKRISDVSAVLNAVSNRIADNNGMFVSGTCQQGIPTQTMNISDTGEGVDLRPCLVPDYIPELPVDPVAGSMGCTNDSCAGHSYTTGYTIALTDSHRITVCAPESTKDGASKQYCLTR